jgi:hypothetical protein
MTSRSVLSIHPGLSQRGAQRVPQCVRISSRHTGFRAAMPKDRAQPRRGERLAPVGALGYYEQPRDGYIRSLGHQIGLDQPGHVDVKRNRRCLAPLPVTRSRRPPISMSATSGPAPRRARPAQQHQPGHRSIPPRSSGSPAVRWSRVDPSPWQSPGCAR